MLSYFRRVYTYLALCFLGVNFPRSWLGEQIRTRTDYIQFLTPPFNYDKPFSITDQPQKATSNTNGESNKGKTFDYKIVVFKLKKLYIL